MANTSNQYPPLNGPMPTKEDLLWEQVAGLHEELAQLKTRYGALEKQLLGDLELAAKYEAGKPNYPNIAKPPPGLLERIQNGLEAHDRAISDIRASGAKVHEKWLHLSAYFAPLIDGKNPPLDAEQVASKAFVDKSLATLAGALREERARDRAELSSARKYVGIVADRIRQDLDAVMKVVYGNDKRKARRSRLAALVYALTGIRPRPEAA